jgi:hypothetical protein
MMSNYVNTIYYKEELVGSVSFPKSIKELLNCVLS